MSIITTIEKRDSNLSSLNKGNSDSIMPVNYKVFGII